MTNLLEILIWTLPLEGVALFRIGGIYITLPLICCTLIVLWKTLCTLTGGRVSPLSYTGWARMGHHFCRTAVRSKHTPIYV